MGGRYMEDGLLPPSWALELKEDGLLLPKCGSAAEISAVVLVISLIPFLILSILFLFEQVFELLL
jgi:hypothetical protein